MRITLFLFLLFLFFSSQAEASRSLSITSNKNFLHGEEDMIVFASHSGFLDSEKVHIKGAFYQTGSTNYFGLTKKNDEWIKNSASSDFQLQIEVGVWDKMVVVKPDFSDSGFKGNDSYNFKLGYYYFTSGGNISSVNWSNSISVGLEKPITVIEPEVVVTQVNSKISETKTIVSPTPTKYQNIAKNIKNDSISDKITRPSEIPSDFARIKKNKNDKKDEPKREVLGESEENNLFYPILFMGFGLFLPSILYLIYKNFDQIKLWIQKE